MKVSPPIEAAIFGAVLIVLNVLLTGLLIGGAEQLLGEPSGPAAKLSLAIVPASVGFIALWILVPRPPKDPVFLGPRAGWLFLLVPAGMLGLSAGLDGILELCGAEGGALEEIHRAVVETPWPTRGFLVLATAVMPALGEELFFRGTVLGRAGQSWAGIAVSALLFGLAHFDVWQSPTAAIMGLYLGWFAVRSGSLWPGILAHAVNNGLFTLLPEAGHGWPTAWVVGLGLVLAAVSAALGARVLGSTPPFGRATRAA
ncbi:MAG: type II CAAX endopeptidase family protein [Myxococcota bacterium]